MSNYLKLVKAIDRATDYIPVVSTLKNACILLYQRVHKVNKAAAPLVTSWKDDIKIHVLSKDRLEALTAMIPVIGNLTTFIINAQNDAAKAQRLLVLGRPMGYLAEASRQWSASLKTHSQEVATLYLARNPNRSLASMEKALKFAVVFDNQPVIAAIVNSRQDWSTKGIIEALKTSRTPAVTNYLLKNFNNKINAGDIAEVLEHVLSSPVNNKENLTHVLFTYFPKMPIDNIARGLNTLMKNAYQQRDQEAKNNDLNCLFDTLEHFPTIDVSQLLRLAELHNDTQTLNKLQASKI